MFGVFEAVGEPGRNLEPTAWAGAWPRSPNDAPPTQVSPFPAQVRVKVAPFFMVPLQRSTFMECVSVVGGTRFRSNLSVDETQRLLQAFVAANTQA